MKDKHTDIADNKFLKSALLKILKDLNIDISEIESTPFKIAEVTDEYDNDEFNNFEDNNEK